MGSAGGCLEPFEVRGTPWRDGESWVLCEQRQRDAAGSFSWAAKAKSPGALRRSGMMRRRLCHTRGFGGGWEGGQALQTLNSWAPGGRQSQLPPSLAEFWGTLLIQQPPRESRNVLLLSQLSSSSGGAQDSPRSLRGAQEQPGEAGEGTQGGQDVSVTSGCHCGDLQLLGTRL